MNEDFLSYYRENLVHLRQMGTEFGSQFPKVASRLNLTKKDFLREQPFLLLVQKKNLMTVILNFYSRY